MLPMMWGRVRCAAVLVLCLLHALAGSRCSTAASVHGLRDLQHTDLSGAASPLAPPSNVYGLNGTVAYMLYAENFPGACWGQRTNAAINECMRHGNGSCTVQLPPGHLNVSEPIRFWLQEVGPEPGRDTTASAVAASRNLSALWTNIRGARQTDLPRGLTLRGSGGTTGDVFNGGTVLHWTGLRDNVMVEMPAPWHAQLRSLTLHGNWVPGVVGVRYRPGWEFVCNGGKDNGFFDLNFQGLDVGMIVGDPLSPDLVGSAFERIEMAGVRVGFLLYGANVAEQHFTGIHINEYYGAGVRLKGTSGRRIRTRAQALDPVPAGVEVLTDTDDATEIFWEQLPPYAQQSAPAVHNRTGGPAGYAAAGGGSPTATFSNFVSSSAFCAAWLFDSNGAALRLNNLRLEGCTGLYRNNATHTAATTRVRFNDVLINAQATSGGGADGNLVSFRRDGPLYVLGGNFRGPFAVTPRAVVFNLGANFDNYDEPSTGCLLDGDEWRLPAGSPWVVNASQACTRGVGYTGRTGKVITAPPPSRRSPPVLVGFVQDTNASAPSAAATYEPQRGVSGTAAVAGHATVTSITIPLPGPLAPPYQVFLTPDWRAGSVWAANKTALSFTALFDSGPPAAVGRLDWHARGAPWRGNPSPMP